MIPEPTNERIVPVKFDVPVKNANAVASILFGVIFANKTIKGNLTKHYPITSETTSVNTITNISDKP